MLSVALLFEVRQDYDGWREGKRHTHKKKSQTADVLMWSRSAEAPGRQVEGQAVHSLKGVTLQSVLQGSRQGRSVSGRAESGHLNQKQI